MVRWTAVACIPMVLAGSAIAQQNVIAERQGLMRQMFAAVRPTFAMLRGQTPYDERVVQNALQTIAANALRAPNLFTGDSKTGDTAALPLVWERRAEFESLLARLAQDAKAAQQTMVDEATFRSEFPKVVATCDTCHNTFRRKSS